MKHGFAFFSVSCKRTYDLRPLQRRDSQWYISTIRLYSAIHAGSHWKIRDRN